MKVIFIHWGRSPYVRYALAQATLHSTPLLIEDPQRRYGSMEIDRWFVLRDAMKEYNLDRVLYLDSDVLLYTNPDDDFLGCDLAFSKSHCGHTMFVNNLEALEDFCKYIDINIENKSLIQKTRGRLPGHVFLDIMGDMVLLNNFMFDSGWFFRDTSKIYNNSVYDHNINTESFVYLDRGSGNYYRIIDEKPVKLNSLHFQGSFAKSLMPEYMKFV